MKKLFVTFIFSALAAVSLSARPTGLSVGGGASFDFCKSKFDIIDVKDANKETYFGAFAEVGYDFTFTKHSSLYAGARLNEQICANFKDILSDTALKSSNKFYLDIPIKYRFTFDVSSKVQMYVNAGPTCSFWLLYNSVIADGKVKKATDINSIDWLYGKDTKGNFNQVNLGLGGALGVYFYHVRIEVGYDQYVTNWYTKDAGVKGNRGQLRIGAAYVF